MRLVEPVQGHELGRSKKDDIIWRLHHLRRLIWSGIRRIGGSGILGFDRVRVMRRTCDWSRLGLTRLVSNKTTTIWVIDPDNMTDDAFLSGCKLQVESTSHTLGLALRGSLSPPDFGGRTKGMPKHSEFGHSSANIAQPFNMRFPISIDA